MVLSNQSLVSKDGNAQNSKKPKSLLPGFKFSGFNGTYVIIDVIVFQDRTRIFSCYRIEDEKEFAVKFYIRWNKVKDGKLRDYRGYSSELVIYYQLDGAKHTPDFIDHGRLYDPETFFIVMERMGRCLDAYVKLSYYFRFSLHSAYVTVLEMLYGLHDIHSRGIVSADIKLENFCLAYDLSLEEAPKVKILDFGLGKNYSIHALKQLPNSKTSEINLKKFVGTPSNASRAAYFGIEFCPYDDLESFFYSIVELFGLWYCMPWPRVFPIASEHILIQKEYFWKGNNSYLFDGLLAAIYTFIRDLDRSKPIPYDRLLPMVESYVKNCSTPDSAYPTITRKDNTQEHRIW